MLLDPHTPIGQGARRRCLVCNFPITVRPTGRTRLFCSTRCRDEARRQGKFQILEEGRYPPQGLPRNFPKTSTKSKAESPTLAGRGFAVTPPIVAIGLGLHVPAPPAESSSERARLIQKAIRLELAARWRGGGAR
jgi:hypothetical protein